MKETGSQPPRSPFFFPGVVVTVLLSHLALASCSFGRRRPTDDTPTSVANVPATPAPANASPPLATPAPLREQRVGVVRVIGDAQRFVLIEVPVGGAGPLPEGMLLRSTSQANDALTYTVLRVSTERRRPFIVADVLTGEPHVGDAVFVDRTANSAAAAKPTILPTATSGVLPIVIPGATSTPPHP